MKKTAITLGLLLACLLTFAEEQVAAAPKTSSFVYDDHHIISLGEHNHQEFFDMARDLKNSTAVVLFIYARKYFHKAYLLLIIAWCT